MTAANQLLEPWAEQTLWTGLCRHCGRAARMVDDDHRPCCDRETCKRGEDAPLPPIVMHTAAVPVEHTAGDKSTGQANPPGLTRGRPKDDGVPWHVREQMRGH